MPKARRRVSAWRFWVRVTSFDFFFPRPKSALDSAFSVYYTILHQVCNRRCGARRAAASRPGSHYRHTVSIRGSASGNSPPCMTPVMPPAYISFAAGSVPYRRLPCSSTFLAAVLSLRPNALQFFPLFSLYYTYSKKQAAATKRKSPLPVL